jgi:hypothetical protein
MKVEIDKNPVLKKLKEINMAAQEDRKGPEAEMERVAKKEEKFEGTNTEYMSSIYDTDELKALERKGSHPNTAPTKEQAAVEEDK